jgi:serine/threonine protein kinase
LPIVKLVDFGLSIVLPPGSTVTHACGTPLYMAPEIFEKTGYNEQVDMWSLGVLTFMLY